MTQPFAYIRTNTQVFPAYRIFIQVVDIENSLNRFVSSAEEPDIEHTLYVKVDEGPPILLFTSKSLTAVEVLFNNLVDLANKGRRSGYAPLVDIRGLLEEFSDKYN